MLLHYLYFHIAYIKCRKPYNKFSHCTSPLKWSCCFKRSNTTLYSSSVIATREKTTHYYYRATYKIRKLGRLQSHKSITIWTQHIVHLRSLKRETEVGTTNTTKMNNGQTYIEGKQATKPIMKCKDIHWIKHVSSERVTSYYK